MYYQNDLTEVGSFDFRKHFYCSTIKNSTRVYETNLQLRQFVVNLAYKIKLTFVIQIVIKDTKSIFFVF